MDIQSIVTNPSVLLASGGIFAGVMAGWSNVKSFFSYISSFVVIQVTLDGYLATRPVYEYLKLNYKQPPSGLYFYQACLFFIKSKGRDASVPFRLTPTSTIFYRKTQILFVSFSGREMKIRALRGLFNPEKLLGLALDIHEAKYGESKVNRFQIHRLMGYQNGTSGRGLQHIGAGTNRGMGTTPSSARDDEEPVGRSSAHATLDTYLDKSFRYEQSDYILDTKEDDPFEGLYYSEEILNCVEQLKLWFSMQDWYNERKVPWRRGCLFHSSKGATGKSSLAKAIARTLEIPLYVFHLATMSDQEFIEKWDSMDTPCIPLFEDFDTVFNKRENLTEHKSLTFECVLNQISGVQSKSGILLIVTTNRIECIDEALGVSCDSKGTLSTRPGRIDSVLEFGMINTEHKYAMARSILRDWPEQVDAIVASSGDITPMQFNEMCVQCAYEILANKPMHLKLLENAA